MIVDIAQLEVFVAVADHGGITAAADALLRAPSNVSVRVKQLEDELGVTLLIRDKRRASLSADGIAFLEYARRIVELTAEAKDFTRANEPRGHFRVGALESTAAVRVPPLLASFHLAYPLVDIELEARSSGILHERLMSGEISAAFTDGAPAAANLTGVPIFREELLVLTPRSVTDISDSFRENRPTAFVFGTGCSYRQKFEDWMYSANVRPGRLVEISSYYAMLACVAAGAGICMMPRSLFESLPGGTEVRPHAIPKEYGGVETYLTWRREMQSVTLRAFVEHAVRSNDAAQTTEVTSQFPFEFGPST